MKELIERLEEAEESGLAKLEQSIEEISRWGSGRKRSQSNVTQTDWHWLRSKLKTILDVAKKMNEDVA